MLLLNSTSKIQVVTGSTGTIEVHASWMDFLAGVVTPGPTNTPTITTATTTDVVASPAASTTRNVKFLSVSNDHATTSNAIDINHTDGTNVETIWQGTLLAGETVVLDANGIWTVYTANGVPKLASTKLDAKLVVTSDVINATTSFADVTGLTQAIQSGKKYNFECHLYHIENAATTGAQFGYNIGAAPTVVRIQEISVVIPSLTASTMQSNAGDVTARDTAAVVSGTSATTPGVVLAILSGYIQPSADGTFAIRCASEVAVAAGLTVKAGSWLRIWEADN
jgi:hypothetical protein